MKYSKKAATAIATGHALCWMGWAAPAPAQAVNAPADAAQAQAVSAPADGHGDTQSAPSAQQGGIEDIVVTARKRVESAQTVPAAVVALSSAEIERYDLSNLEKIANMTPGFTITRASNGAGAQLVMRGIGSSFTSIGIEQSVATVVDNVYYGQGRVINEGFFDLARAELLKGPQSLFFGKNSTAGVVSLTTMDPSSEQELIARAGYEFKARQVIAELIGSTPLSDALGIRVALRGSKMYGGYFKNVANTVIYSPIDLNTGHAQAYLANPASRNAPGEREFLGRVTLKWQPTPEFTATLKASLNINNNDNAAYNYVIFDCPAGGGSLPAGAPCGRQFVNAMNNVPTDIARVAYGNNGALFNKYNSWGATLNLAYVTDNLNISSITNYNKNRNQFQIDVDYYSGGAVSTWNHEDDHFRAFSTEQRLLTTFNSPVNFMAGVYYQHTSLHVEEPVVILGSLEDSSLSGRDRYASFSKDSSTTNETVAGYGQVIWNLNPQIEATAGVRYTHETKHSYFNQPLVLPAFRGVFVYNDPFTVDQAFDNWSPEATLTYRPAQDIMLYAAYKTGYKSGGFSTTGIASTLGSKSDFVFNPEKARGFEGGIKTTLFDRQFRFNVTGYHYKYSDMQIDFFNSVTTSFVTTNAGSATTEGFEIEAEFAPRAVPSLRIHGSLNYNRARYQDYIAPCYAGQLPSEGCSIVENGVNYQDISGKPTASAPLWSGAFGFTFERPINDGVRFALSADARYSDSYIANAFANPAARQPAYVSLDASARVHTSDDRWELALIGRNLTNRFVINGSHDVVGTGSGTGTVAGQRAFQVGLVSPPRTVQMQITYRY